LLPTKPHLLSEGREYAPKGDRWEQAIAYWKTLKTDEGAKFDKEVTIDATQIKPMITYGTNPGMGMRLTDRSPNSKVWTRPAK